MCSMYSRLINTQCLPLKLCFVHQNEKPAAKLTKVVPEGGTIVPSRNRSIAFLIFPIHLCCFFVCFFAMSWRGGALKLNVLMYRLQSMKQLLLILKKIGIYKILKTSGGGLFAVSVMSA